MLPRATNRYNMCVKSPRGMFLHTGSAEVYQTCSAPAAQSQQLRKASGESGVTVPMHRFEQNRVTVLLDRLAEMWLLESEAVILRPVPVSLNGQGRNICHGCGRQRSAHIYLWRDGWMDAYASITCICMYLGSSDCLSFYDTYVFYLFIQKASL